MNRLFSFTKRQVAEFKAGGWKYVKNKTRTLLHSWDILLAAPLVLLTIVLRPIVLLRFGTLRSDRFGHFSADVEAYLCLRESEISRARTFDIVGCPHPVCNRQLETMWRRVMKITPFPGLWGVMDRACQLWTQSTAHHVRLAGRASQMGVFFTAKQYLQFTTAEQRQGGLLLEKLGIPPEAEWVCVHNRDGAFLEKTLPEMDWSYHNYRDFGIETMMPAIEELTARGYYVLRMGSVAEEPMNLDDPMVIDYPHHPACSAFADIYLLGQCKFYFGSDSGIFSIPAIFRKPYAFINFPVLQSILDLYPWNPTPFILKRVRHIETQRLLSLRELLETGLANAFQASMYADAGIELICNTPDEIRDFAIELDERLTGEWQPTAEDEALQQRFWKEIQTYSPTPVAPDIQACIGTAYLRKHQDILG